MMLHVDCEQSVFLLDAELRHALGLQFVLMQKVTLLEMLCTMDKLVAFAGYRSL